MWYVWKILKLTRIYTINNYYQNTICTFEIRESRLRKKTSFLFDSISPCVPHQCNKYSRLPSTYRDRVSYGTALTWTLLLPVWKAFTSTRNQMYASDTSRNPLQSCLVFHSILDLLQKTSFWANFNSSYDIILSYLVKNSIQRNMNRRGAKRIGAGRGKSPLFAKITKEMNQ